MSCKKYNTVNCEGDVDACDGTNDAFGCFKPEKTDNHEPDIQASAVLNGSAKCDWTRTFDGHFNITCPLGYRGNGHALRKGYKFCPFCGRTINFTTA